MNKIRQSVVYKVTKSIGNWCFFIYIGVTMLVGFISSTIYQSDILSIGRSLDQLGSSLSGYVGFYRVIDRGMNGNANFKAILTIHLMALPLFSLVWRPLLRNEKIFHSKNISGYLLVFSGAIFILFFGPMPENLYEPGKVSRYINFMGINQASFSFGIGIITSLITSVLFIVIAMLRGLFIKGKGNV